jgi:predicted transcriptional regulator
MVDKTKFISRMLSVTPSETDVLMYIYDKIIPPFEVTAKEIASKFKRSIVRVNQILKSLSDKELIIKSRDTSKDDNRIRYKYKAVWYDLDTLIEEKYNSMFEGRDKTQGRGG